MSFGRPAALFEETTSASDATGRSLIKPDTYLRAGIIVSYYSQHRRSFLAGVPPPAVFSIGQERRYAEPSNKWPIHKFRSYLSSQRWAALSPISGATVNDGQLRP